MEDKKWKKYLYNVINENDGNILGPFQDRESAILYFTENYNNVIIKTRVATLLDNKVYRQTYVTAEDETDENDFTIECIDAKTDEHVTWKDELNELNELF